MNIRTATADDSDVINGIYLTAFPESENTVVARLAIDLLSERTEPETISLVAEIDDTVVGHVAFSPVTASKDSNFLGYILAPLAIAPAHQHSGIGESIVRYGIDQLIQRDVDAVFVYGDPDYYSRFGFNISDAKPFLPPYQLKYPLGWQALTLNGYANDGRPKRINCVTPLCNAELW